MGDPALPIGYILLGVRRDFEDARLKYVHHHTSGLNGLKKKSFRIGDERIRNVLSHCDGRAGYSRFYNTTIAVLQFDQAESVYLY